MKTKARTARRLRVEERKVSGGRSVFLLLGDPRPGEAFDALTGQQVTPGPEVVGRANAREDALLFAAAPDLLRRLESLVFHGDGKLPEVEIRLAKQAIARSEGRA